MLDGVGPAGIDRMFTVLQVERERGTGVRRRAGAEQIPHICLLLEDKGGHREHIWEDEQEKHELLLLTEWYEAAAGGAMWH